jgi:hypothetical protein
MKKTKRIMKRAMNAAVYAQDDVYWRIGAQRKSPKGIPYVDVLLKSNEV